MRRYEREADRIAVELTGTAEHMINALKNGWPKIILQICILTRYMPGFTILIHLFRNELALCKP
jgi:hypothetical protein